MTRYLSLIALLFFTLGAGSGGVLNNTVDQGTQGTTTLPWYVNLRNVSGTEIGISGSPIATMTADTAPANQTITALDIVTSSLTGANGQVFYFGTPTTNSAASFTLSSIETVVVQANLLGAGGTMVVEVSNDGGTAWFRPNVFQIATQSYTNGFTAPFSAVVNVAGMTNIRVRGTVSWSGTATIILKESLNHRSVTIGDALPAGANAIGSVAQSGTWTVQQGSTPTAVANAWPVKLTDGTNTTAVKAASTAPIATDPAAVVVQSPNGNHATAANQTSEITALQIIDNTAHANDVAFNNGIPSMGQLDDTSTGTVTENNVSTVRITPSRGWHVNLRNAAGTELGTDASPLVVAADDGGKATYSATGLGFLSAALATDIFTITGSGTKTIKILRLEMSATAAAGGSFNALLIKRSTADTGGTSTTLTSVPHDSTASAATATVRSYTANPTVGTSVGTIRTTKLFVSGASTTASVDQEWLFGTRPGQAVTLRGTGEVLAVNLNATTLTSGNFDVDIEWTEE